MLVRFVYFVSVTETFTRAWRGRLTWKIEFRHHLLNLVHIECWLKFRFPQNIYGASRQNCLSALSIYHSLASTADAWDD